MSDKIAISLHAALRTVWNSGLTTEPQIRVAYDRLMSMVQPTMGYVYPDDVQKLILNMKQEFKK